MKKVQRAAISLLGLMLLLSTAWGLNSVFANHHAKTAAPLTTSSKPAVASMVTQHTIDMATVPALKAGTSSRANGLPALEGNKQAYANHKQAAAHSSAAPHPSTTYQLPASAQPNTPTFIARIQGMTDASSDCNCQPPDMALAVSTSWIFQGVNTAFAVYLKTGLQPGWPKSAASFFGIPNPPNNCDSAPFLSDPRAFYDVQDGRFWAEILQVEGAIGVAPNCPEQTDYWIAVSQTSNPNGKWNIYEFDMSLGTTNVADYSQVGFDDQSISFSANMFNQTGSSYVGAEAFSVSKKTMEAGGAVTAFGFNNLMANGVLVDTVQPVEVESPNGSPYKSALFINSFNINSGGGQCSSGCSGVVVWAIANPGTSSSTMTGTVISTNTYTLAPNADQPGCTACVETLDTRISGTPVYHAGLISFALETAINNGTQVVPGIFWGQVAPILNDAGVVTTGAVYQQGFFNFTGDNSASFGAVMPNNDGDLLMVFELMGSAINPEVAYVTRRVTFTLGAFHDHGSALQAGATATTNTRWGDYEATSYDYYTSNDIWFAGQYAGASGDWATVMGEIDLRFTDA